MFLIGMLVGMAVLVLVFYINARRIDVRWYEWSIGAVGFALLLFALQNITASSEGYWETAPWIFFLVFGLPALILLAVGIALPWLRNRRSG